MIEDLGEQQNTGICVTRTRNDAGQDHYTTCRRRRSKKMEKKSCDNCTHRGVWGCPSRDGSPCESWSGVPLSPTMRKLSAMLREELR